LIAGYLTLDAERGHDRTLREFLIEFKGLMGTAKQKAVLEKAGLIHESLSALCNQDGLDRDRISRLLEAMNHHTRPVKPKALGVIGEIHVRNRFEVLGCEIDSFKYRRRFGKMDGVPWVQETAFAYCPKATRRRFVTGVNWSPGIINPFRELGRFGESLDGVLEHLWAGSEEPLVLFLHIACPRVEYTDRGKSTVVVGGRGEDDTLDEQGEED
jgi:hypothetical protein